MASNEQELMFGDFGDLSPEEHKRIYHILHGQKSQAARKVEFPWTSGSEELDGAVGGNAAFSDQGGTFTSQSWVEAEPAYGRQSELGFQSNSYLGDINYTVHFGFSGNDSQISETLDEDIGNMEHEHMSESSAHSKLQASLKPYERRNKKRRPPGYYNKQGTEYGSQMAGHNQSGIYNYNSERGQQEMSRGNYLSEMRLQMSSDHNQNHGSVNGPHYTDSSVSSVNMPLPVHQHPPYQTDVYTGGYSFNLPLSAHDAIISNNSQGDRERQRDGDLFEVVVESVPQNSADVPARTETYQIQDHDRTNNVLHHLTASVNVNNPTEHSENNSATFPNLQIHSNSTTFPSGVSNISDTNKDHVATVHHHRVDVSVKDAPVVDYSSQSQSENLPFNVSAHVVQHEPSGSVPNEGQTGKLCMDSQNLDVNETKNIAVAETVDTAMETNAAHFATPSDTINAPAVQEMAKPKPISWAGLFKPSSTTSGANVSSVKIDNSVSSTEDDRRSEKEYSPLPVPATEDSVAKQLGEMLSQMSISHTSVSLQPRGLVNRGNWCYINGTLQALVACPPFYNLLKKLPRYPALSRGPSSTPILDALVEFVHEFQPMSRPTERGPRSKTVRDISPGAPFEPSYVYKMLQTIACNPHFKLGKQEDAEEFLSCILDGVHEEMSAAVNLTEKHIDTDGVEDEGYTNGFMHHTDGENEDEEAENQEGDNWEQVGPKKKSVLTRRSNFAKTPIADIFAGMIRSAVYKATAKETATLEPFFTLQLDIQSDKVWSVKDALEGLVSKEPVSGYTCSKTNTEVEVVKKLSLEELPPVLVMHLKFFVYNKDGGSQKLTKKVDFPVELEITKDLLSPNARNKLSLQQRSYKLFAVVYHHGKTLTGGHYTTSVFHPGINGWVYSDDSTVKTTTVSQVLKHVVPRVPYLLYYRRLDSH